MAKRKITVTVDEALVDEARALGETSLSAVVNRALADHLDHLARLRALGDLLDRWDAEFGPLSEEQLAMGEALFDEAEGLPPKSGAA